MSESVEQGSARGPGVVMPSPSYRIEPHADASIPDDVLDALIRLNPHARAYGSGKRAIYAYKTLAATKLALQRAFLRVEFIEWQGKCRDCDGSGRYYHWSGDRADHCWKCNSSGTAKLRFLETTLPNGHVWHHPWEGPGAGIAELTGAYRWDGDKGQAMFFRDGKEVAEVWWRPNDWTPNEHAEKLPAEDAAAALNVVEEWVLHDWPSVQARWRHDAARREMRRYRLDLGRVGERCWYCESTDINCGLHVTSGVLEWSAPVCREHGSRPVAMWPTLLPESAVTPSVGAWRWRHNELGFDNSDRWL